MRLFYTKIYGRILFTWCVHSITHAIISIDSYGFFYVQKRPCQLSTNILLFWQNHKYSEIQVNSFFDYGCSEEELLIYSKVNPFCSPETLFRKHRLHEKSIVKMLVRVFYIFHYRVRKNANFSSGGRLYSSKTNYTQPLF